MVSANELQRDVKELQRLLSSDALQSDRLREIFAKQLKHDEFALEQLLSQTPHEMPPSPAKPQVAAPVKKEEIVFTSIGTFGWEDQGFGKNKVSVYITSGVDGVGELAPEHVSCDFTKDSFDLKIMNLNGKNMRLLKTNLEKEILPEKSTFRVKQNRVTITLWKQDNNTTWMKLTDNKAKDAKKTKSDDPTAGIMDMMKDMYDNGDPEMKRTIAKAWSESRNKTNSSEFGNLST